MMLFLSLLMVFSGIAWAGYLFWRDKRRAAETPKETAYQQVSRNPATQEWLKNNLVGNPIDDVRAIRAQFGLSTEDAEKFVAPQRAFVEKMNFQAA